MSTPPNVTEPLTCCPGAAETWAPIPDFPHWSSDHDRFATARGRILKPKNNNRPENGPPFYQLVKLCADGKEWTFSAHKLHLVAHRGPCCDQMPPLRDRKPCPVHESRHLDDVPDHNHLTNLAWGTADQNAADKARQPRYATAEAAERRKAGAHAANRKRRAQRERDLADLAAQSPAWRLASQTDTSHRPSLFRRVGSWFRNHSKSR